MFNSIKTKFNNIPQTVKVSVAYAVCSILQRCLSFFTTPLFARMLTEEQYGLFIIYQSWNGILTIIITLNLAYGSFSKAMIKFEKDREGYIASVQGVCLLLAAVFFVIYLPFRKMWNVLFELPTIFICLMVVEILATVAIQLWSGKKRFEFKYKSVVIVTIIMSVISPVLAFLMVKSTEEKGYARILGYSIVTIVFGLFFYILNFIRGKRIYNKEYWKYGLGFNVPLIAYYLSQMVFNQSDRIMIDHLIGRDKAADYGVAYSLAMVLTFVINATNNSYIPWFYLKIKEGKVEENKKISLYISVLIAIMLSAVIWFAPELVLIVGGEKYAEAVYVVPPVAISLLLLFYSQMFICYEFYYEQKKKLVFASLAASLLNLLLNWMFIPVWGYVAAAYTTLFSYIIFAVSNCFAMKKILKENKLEDCAYNYGQLILLFLVLGFCSIIGVLLYSFIWIRIIIAIVVAVVLFIKRKPIFKFVKTFFYKKKQAADM